MKGAKGAGREVPDGPGKRREDKDHPYRDSNLPGEDRSIGERKWREATREQKCSEKGSNAGDEGLNSKERTVLFKCD
jgi:hypothetical protein